MTYLFQRQKPFVKCIFFVLDKIADKRVWQFAGSFVIKSLLEVVHLCCTRSNINCIHSVNLKICTVVIDLNLTMENDNILFSGLTLGTMEFSQDPYVC